MAEVRSFVGHGARALISRGLAATGGIPEGHDIEDGYRKLKRFAQEAGLDEGEALSFLFENFDSVMDKENLTHRLRLFNSELEDRKR